MTYNMNDENVCNDCGIKIVQCDMCGCCAACCDCGGDASGVFAPSETLALVSFDAIGTCQGCGAVGNVNGYEFCEWCMDEFDE